MTMTTFLLALLQGALALALSPLLVGLVRQMKARFQNRRGAPITQPYWALAAQLKKEMTIPEHSSWVFRFVPYAVLTVTIALTLLVPTFSLGALPLAFSNIFLFAGLSILGSVFLVFGGMDTGSNFGNMGSSREMTLAALAEPALIVVLVTLAYLAGSSSIDGMLAFFAQTPWGSSWALAVPSMIALLFVVLAENARYPVDNPSTHLELTMVHEAMLLEYSGPYLAALEYAASLRLMAFGALFMNILVPVGLVTPLASPLVVLTGIALFVAKLFIFALIVAAIESTIVKMRFYRMQEYFMLAFSIALVGAAIVVAALL